MVNKFTKNASKKIGELVYRYFEKGSGSMILLTSMSAIGLSCLAQTGAVLLNKKYSVSQKAFMVPQEIAEGAMTIISMFIVTKPLQKLAFKLNKTGKIATKEMVEYMKKNNLFSKRGEHKFDFEKSVNSIIREIEKSDKFIKSTEVQKENLVRTHNDILRTYEETADATSAITTTLGSAFTTALISPIIRNAFASYSQKLNLKIYDRVPDEYKKRHEQNLQLRTPLMRNIYGYDSPQMKI